MSLDTLQSSYRERLLEHLLISKLLTVAWQSGDCALEISQPEVDRCGYDLIAEANNVLRHIQLKTTATGSTTKRQTVSVRLALKPSGCVVVVCFDKKTLELGPFLFFGSAPQKPLPSLKHFRLAKNVRANAKGKKAKRTNHRVVPHTNFKTLKTVRDLYEHLFGAQPALPADGPRAARSARR